MIPSAPRRVCVLTSAHRPFDSRIFQKECRTLAAEGYRVILIVQHDKVELIDGVRIIPLPKPKSRLGRMLWTTLRLTLIAIRQDVDVYHFHDPELIPWAVLLKIISKRQIIYDVHEDVPQQILSKQYIPTMLKHCVARVYDSMEKTAAKYFDHIICATDVIAQNFIPFNPSTSTVRNYISMLYARQYITDLERRSRGDFIMVFAGGIYEERGILEAVRALYLLPDLKITFILCGDIDPRYYERIVEEDRLCRVIYKGVLPYEEALRETSRADIGYICDYPLKRHIEGLPIKLFEYMAMGVPIIASDFPIWSEIVQGCGCGLTVDPLNPKDIARSVRYLLENEDARKTMGENGRRAVIEKYNWETEAQTFLHAYKSLEANN